MPRRNHNSKCWVVPEIKEVLDYVNKNVELWVEYPYSVCKKLNETNNTITRDVRSIYSKVYRMIKLMEMEKNNVIW